MGGIGSREDFGSSPWDPADPVDPGPGDAEPDATQEIPGFARRAGRRAQAWSVQNQWGQQPAGPGGAGAGEDPHAQGNGMPNGRPGPFRGGPAGGDADRKVVPSAGPDAGPDSARPGASFRPRPPEHLRETRPQYTARPWDRTQFRGNGRPGSDEQLRETTAQPWSAGSPPSFQQHSDSRRPADAARYPDTARPNGAAQPNGTGQFRGTARPGGTAPPRGARSLTGPLVKIAESTGPIVRLAGTRLAALHARQRRKFWRELPVLVVVAIVLALIIKTYAVQAFYIPSGSMQNTLAIGDRVLINKIVYHTRGIARGDIIVFNGDGSWDPVAPSQNSNPIARLVDALEGIVGITHGSDVYIKRVVGLPGDRVKCCDAQGRVTVNGVPLTEQSYLFPGNKPSMTPFTSVVPPGNLWVMGDHRDVSYDSRGHMGDPGGGSIPQSAVMGRAFVIIWPPSKWGFLNIPATFEQPKLTGTPAAAGGSPASLAAALDGNTVRVQPAWSPLPLALGTAGAVPLTWLQRRARRRLTRARRARR